MLFDDPVGAAELGQRGGAKEVRAALALDLPQPLEHELEIGSLDAPRPPILVEDRLAGQPLSIRPAPTCSSTASTSSGSAVTTTPPSSP